MTSIEQTTLDLTRRRTLVDGMEAVVDEALSEIAVRCDIRKMRSIAENQNMKSTMIQIMKMVKDA